jgi:thrombospondin type 3 repeat protein
MFRRVFLAMAAVLAFAALAVPATYGQGAPPDSDGDGVSDQYDACPNVKGDVGEDDEALGNGCPDKDHDGVQDSADACPTQGGSQYGGGVDGQGCPKVTAFFNFPTQTTWDMGHGHGELVVCKDTPQLAHCSMRVNVSLTAASAKRLGIKNPELVDRTVKTTKRSTVHEMVTGRWEWHPSKALTAALKKDGRSVTLIMSGAYKVDGSGEWAKMDKDKVVVKPKSCGWNSFSCV